MGRARGSLTRGTTNKEIADIVRTVEHTPGWSVGLTGNNHLRFSPPDPDAAPIITGSNPSCYRALANVRAQLRRAGLETDPRRLARKLKKGGKR